MESKKRIKYIVAISAFLFVYVCSFIILSEFGKYETYYANVEEGVFSEWQPKYVTYSTSSRSKLKSNALGYLYSPQIYIDRKFVHSNTVIWF
jgi:hypothetical protein